MSIGSIRCPNCGHDASGGVMVCQDCGKVYCCYCTDEGKNPFGGNTCPRCGSNDNISVTDFRDIGKAMKNSQN